MPTTAGAHYAFPVPEPTDVGDIPASLRTFALDLDTKMAAVEKRVRFMEYPINVPFSIMDANVWANHLNRSFIRCYGGQLVVGMLNLQYVGSASIAVPANGNISDYNLVVINDTRYYPPRFSDWEGNLSGTEYSGYGYVHSSTGRAVLQGLNARSGVAASLVTGTLLRIPIYYHIPPLPIDVNANPGTAGPVPLP